MQTSLRFPTLRLLFGTTLVLIVVISIPLAQSAPTPGVPVLYFSSQGGPYNNGQSAQVQFKVQNRGPDGINALTISVAAGEGWSVLTGAISIGSLASGEERSFVIQAKVSSASFASIIFTAKSSDHVQLNFPVSVWIGSQVTPETIARTGEAVSSLLSMATQWGTYTVYQVGSLIFPSKPVGITDQSGFQDMVRGYFVKSFLGTSSGRNLPSMLTGFVNQISTVNSQIDSMHATSTQGYSFSIPYLLSSLTYSTNLYQFLTWRLPLHQWTLGLRDDWGVPDMLAWAIQKFAGVNVSANDIVQLANFLQSGRGPSLLSYVSGISGASQLIANLANANTPDLNGLLQLINSVGQIANSLSGASNLIGSIISGTAQRTVNWIRQLQQQLYQIFKSLMDWISANIPLISGAINKVLQWLDNALVTAVNYVVGILDTGSKAQSSAQSAQIQLSDMSASVGQWQGAYGQLSSRLQQVADESRQKWDGFCQRFQPVVPMIQRITKWAGYGLYVATMVTGAAAVSITTPLYLTVQGFGLVSNTVDASCSYSRTGSLPDLVAAISMAAGAVILLGDVFPAEERDFQAIGNTLNAIATGVSAASSIQNSMAGSGFDLTSITRLIATYDSAGKQGAKSYAGSSPDYVAAIGAIDSVSNLPSLDAVNQVLNDVKPCGNTMTRFASYEREGMKAPDLHAQVAECQLKGQGAVSAVANGDYSSITQADSLPGFASELSGAIETRHREYIAAKEALERLSSAVSSLRGCGFLWAHPNPSALDEGQRVLNDAQAKFSAGSYANVTDSISQELLGTLHSDDQSCRQSAMQVWVWVGAVAMVGAVALVVAFMYIRKSRRHPMNPKKH
jgi:hypothetical protein